MSFQIYDTRAPINVTNVQNFVEERQYLFASTLTTQSVGSGDTEVPVVFDTLASSNGAAIVQPSTTTFSLAEGFVYKLRASLPFVESSTKNLDISVRFYDVTDAVAFGSGGSGRYDNSTDFIQGMLLVDAVLDLISATGPHVVELRVENDNSESFVIGDASDAFHGNPRMEIVVL